MASWHTGLALQQMTTSQDLAKTFFLAEITSCKKIDMRKNCWILKSNSDSLYAIDSYRLWQVDDLFEIDTY